MSNISEISIRPEEYFVLSNGRALKNLYELMNALESMDSDTFNFHVNSGKNDFGNWIKHVFKDDLLADSIYKSGTKDSMIKAIESKLFEKKDEKLENGSTSIMKLEEPKTLVKSYPFMKSFKKPQQQKPVQNQSIQKTEPQSEISSSKIDEILLKEKEIEKREQKIEEIEERIEKELAGLATRKDSQFFTSEFIQGLLIGLLLTLIGSVAYIKYFI